MEENITIEIMLKKYGVPERFLDCSFDNFLGKPQLVNFFQELSNEKPFPTTTMMGKPGCGKTHLAVALLRKFQIDNRLETRSVEFIPATELLLILRRSFNSNENTEFDIIKKYSELDLLILDDLGSEKISDWSISTLFLILNNRYNNMKPTIITTNFNTNEIEKQFGARISSRLSSGKICTIDMPDYRKKREH